MRFLKEVGHHIRSMTQLQDPQSFHYLCQQVSVCVQKFDSVCIRFLLTCVTLACFDLCPRFLLSCVLYI